MFGIDELVSVLPPPAVPWSPFTEAAWLDLFATFGTRLPEDFVRFHATYGEGFLVSRSHPSTASISLYAGILPEVRPDRTSFRYQVPRRLIELRQAKSRRPRSIPQLFFEPSGLLPWGRASNGVDLCWCTSGDLVDTWRTTVLHAGKGAHEAFDVSALEFFARVISGNITCALLPPHFPGPKGAEFRQSIVAVSRGSA